MAVGLKSTADGVGDASGAAAGAGDAARGPASWPELGIAGWLADRAEALGLRTPTGEGRAAQVQRRAAPVILGGQDCIVQSETGSGKTLAFLLPLLSMLDYPPAVYPDDLRGPQAAVVVPTRELGVQARGARGARRGAAAGCRGQVAMLAFKLLGGSVNVGVPGARENMFHYDGPRGIKAHGRLLDAGAGLLGPPLLLLERGGRTLAPGVRGLLLDEELEHAKKDFYLKGVHVVVGTPAMIAAALAPPDPLPSVMQHVKVVAVDEVDACYQDHLEDMQALMDAACASSSCATRLAARPGGGSDAVSAAAASSGSSDGASSSSSSSSSQGAAAGQRRDKPVVVLVGATTGDDLVAAAVQHGWLSEPVVVAVGGRMRVPAGLSHRYVVTEPQRKVAVLCRQIRDDLRQQGDDAPPARAMVFARSEEQARQLSSPLRTALWGDHTLSVLLPQGAEPIKALHSFRDNRTSLLLATPAAARGLDMPAVSHVYNIGPPADATDYLHRAGRAGRIGSPVKGVVTTLVTPDQLPALQAIAGQLGLEMAQAAEPPPTLADPADIEAAKKGLEDMRPVSKLPCPRMHCASESLYRHSSDPFLECHRVSKYIQTAMVGVEAPDAEEEMQAASSGKHSVIFVLENANLEVAKVGKAYELLNCDDHAGYLRRHGKDPAHYRPDICHQASPACGWLHARRPAGALLTILDSPLNKAGKLKGLYVHTAKNVLIQVNPQVRLPRTFRRFCGLMVQLLQKLSIRATNGPDKLLRVVKGPDRVTKLADDRPVVFVVGAFAHGKIDDAYVDEYISISQFPLSAAYALARITTALEQKWGVV
eukprot:scaffold9.g3266.t1